MAAMVRLRRATATLRSGEKLSIPAWDVDSGKGGPCLLLTAALHGNEVQGCEAMRRFMSLAAKEIVCGKVIGVPFGNLLAVRERRPHPGMTPEQPYGDKAIQNINGTWPGDAKGTDPERITSALNRAFVDEATHLMDTHCWPRWRGGALLIRDTPELRRLARQMGHLFVEVRPPNNCTLSGYVNSTGRVGVCFEGSGQYGIHEEEVRRIERLMGNMARAIGLLGGKPQPLDRPVLFSDACDLIRVKAPVDGLFAGNGLRPRDAVKDGQALGCLLSDRDLSAREIAAPAGGYLWNYAACRPNCDVSLADQHPYVRKGEEIAAIMRPRKA